MTTTAHQPCPPGPAWIGLGANLGDRVGTLVATRAALDQLPGCRVLSYSSLWQSPAFEADGPDYLNAVVGLATNLPPAALLAALQSLEAQFGRLRPYPRAPRTLDLDLLLYGAEQHDTPTLQLPHPRMTQRAFVLRPLAEAAPTLVIPGHGLLHNCLAAVAQQACTPWADPAWPGSQPYQV